MSDIPSFETLSRWARERQSPGDIEVTTATALIAIGKQLEISNKIAVAQVLATLKAGYDTRDAHLLVNKIREEHGI